MSTAYEMRPPKPPRPPPPRDARLNTPVRKMPVELILTSSAQDGATESAAMSRW